MRPLFSSTTASPVAQPQVLPSASANVPAVARRSVLAVKSVDDIARIGAGNTAALSSLSSELFTSMKAADADKLGLHLNQVLAVAKKLDPQSFATKGVVSKLRGLFGDIKEQMFAQYSSVDGQLTRLLKECEGQMTLHQKRVQDLEQHYMANVAYHEALGRDIVELEASAAELQALIADAETGASQAEATSLLDLKRKFDAAEKRADDLRRAQLLSKQAAPQIRLLQDNARTLVDKFVDVRDVTIPAWRNVFTLYLAALEQQQSAKVTQAVDDATDAALRKQSELLHGVSVDIAKSRQRSLVSLDTLVHTQTELLNTLAEVERIETEGRQLRAAEAPKLQALEQQLFTLIAPHQR